MAPNRYSTIPSAEWLAQHGRELVRRAEVIAKSEPTAAEKFARNAGEKIKGWIMRSSSTSIFIATILISLVLLLATCAFIWETLRCCRRRASAKGWRQLEAPPPSSAGHTLYEPRNEGGLYDDPDIGRSHPQPHPQAQAQVQMRSDGLSPPPLPSMPRGYQMPFPSPQPQPQPQPQRTFSHPAPLLPAPQQQQQQQPPAFLRTASVPTSSAHRLQLQDIILTSPVEVMGMRESHQMQQIISDATRSTPYSTSDLEMEVASGRTSGSNDTEPLLLPGPPPSAPLIPASTSVPSTIPAPTTATLVPPISRETSLTASVVSEKAPTVDLRRSGTLSLSNWWKGDEKKEEGELKKE